jgi:hypothetical protein
VTIIADTGALYALADADDRWHRRIVEWWKGNVVPILVPVTVLPEVTYLLQTRIGPAAEEAFVRAVAEGELTTEPLEQEDLVRAADLLRRYADLPLGFVDATVAATAERLGSRTLLTTDRRHFSVVRPKSARTYTLLP